jgi:hypothetical protein
VYQAIYQADPQSPLLKGTRNAFPNFGWRVEQIVFFGGGEDIRMVVEKA